MEKEMEVNFGDSIDQVVGKLLEEEKKGNHMFCKFNGVELHSSDVTYDSAYLAICGCTRDEHKKKISESSHAEEEPATVEELVQRLTAVTAENAIRDMKMTKLLCITKDGVYDSMMANQYIEKMSKYAVYCKTEEKENWTQAIVGLIRLAGEIEDYYILEELQSREEAGDIMEKLANGVSMDDIKKIVADQGHSNISISLLGQVMINFSPYGLDFAEQVIGRYATNSNTSLGKAYKKEVRRRKNLK